MRKVIRLRRRPRAKPADECEKMLRRDVRPHEQQQNPRADNPVAVLCEAKQTGYFKKGTTGYARGASILPFLFYFFISGVSFAAPCYGPKMPQEGKLFGGLQTYSVFNRSLEGGYGKIRSAQNFALLSYGVFDWLSLDLKGGAGNIKQRSAGAGGDLDYPTFLGGGYGFRLKLYDRQATKMVFGFQHISIHPETASAGASKHKAVLDDWQFSFLVSHEVFKITPYLGTRWSRMDKIHWIDGVRKREKSDLGKSVGIIIGTDIPLSEKVWFNAEGQFLDATAVTGSINFAF